MIFFVIINTEFIQNTKLLIAIEHLYYDLGFVTLYKHIIFISRLLNQFNFSEDCDEK